MCNQKKVSLLQTVTKLVSTTGYTTKTNHTNETITNTVTTKKSVKTTKNTMYTNSPSLPPALNRRLCSIHFLVFSDLLTPYRNQLKNQLTSLF